MIQVEVSWSVEVLRTVADETGAWTLMLQTPSAGGPFEIVVTSEELIRLEDVLIGEVWVCSGQSNMEMPVKNVRPGYTGVLNHEEELRDAKYPEIRLFDVRNTYSLEEQVRCEGKWKRCGPESVGEFSATAYFFGRELQQELGVPVGLIGANWGGTRVEAWTSRRMAMGLGDEEALAEIDEFIQSGDTMDELQSKALAGWRRAMQARDPGYRQGWMNPEFDDSAWDSMTLPALWDDTWKGYDGAVWFRNEVQIPKAWRGKALALSLPPIDDMDLTYFDGNLVGESMTMGLYRAMRYYPIDAGLVQRERATIAIRALDTGGSGGLSPMPERMTLGPKDGSSEPLSLAGPWQVKKGLSLDKAPLPRFNTPNQNTHTALFNGMIRPLARFGIRGVIWYQGEANRMNALSLVFDRTLGKLKSHRREVPADSIGFDEPMKRRDSLASKIVGQAEQSVARAIGRDFRERGRVSLIESERKKGSGGVTLRAISQHPDS